MNNKIYTGVLAIALTLNSFSAYANNGEVILGLDLAQSKMKIDKDYSIINEKFNAEAFSLSYVAGYHFTNNVVSEVNLSFSSSDVFFRAFDTYELYELKAMIGYSFEVAPYLRIVSLIGASRWKLDTTEGSLLNSGPEASERFSGTDATYKIRFNIPLNDLIIISLSYAFSNTDFGQFDATQVGIAFEF